MTIIGSPGTSVGLHHTSLPEWPNVVVVRPWTLARTTGVVRRGRARPVMGWVGGRVRWWTGQARSSRRRHGWCCEPSARTTCRSTLRSTPIRRSCVISASRGGSPPSTAATDTRRRPHSGWMDHGFGNLGLDHTISMTDQLNDRPSQPAQPGRDARVGHGPQPVSSRSSRTASGSAHPGPRHLRRRPAHPSRRCRQVHGTDLPSNAEGAVTRRRRSSRPNAFSPPTAR